MTTKIVDVHELARLRRRLAALREAQLLSDPPTPVLDSLIREAAIPVWMDVVCLICDRRTPAIVEVNDPTSAVPRSSICNDCSARIEGALYG